MTEKPTSKRGKVRAVYDKTGEKAALTLGTSLGVGAGRLRRWFRQWAGGDAPSTAEPNLSAPTPMPRPRNIEGKVCLTWRQDLWGSVKEKTKKETTVMWPNGNVNTVPNEWVTPL